MNLFSRSATGAALATALAVTGVPAMAAPAAEAPVVLTLSTQAAGPTISRHLFGQFAEHLGTGIYGGVWVGPDSPIPNVRGIRKDVVAALKALRVPNVRWPGGCFADKYHWRDGIGPRGRRPVTLNPDWGGVEESNAFGSHEFLDFAQQIGADAYLSINVGSGTVAEASGWLEYLTSPNGSTLARERVRNGARAPFKVAMLGIGNETWGCGGSMKPEEYAAELKKYATFVLNHHPAQQQAPNKMLRIASGPNQGDERFTDVVMSHWKDHIYSWGMEGLSLHSYTGIEKWPPSHPSQAFGVDEYAAVLRNTLDMDGYVRRHAAVMDRYDPERKVGLYVDEWGAWYAPLPGSNPAFLQQQNSQRDALIAALNLNIFMRHAERVRGANVAQMVNVLQAMILTSDRGIVLTPTYHAFRLYIPFQDAERLPLAFEAGDVVLGDVRLPRLDAVAARGRDGQVWVALVNLDPAQSLAVELAAEGGAVGAQGEVLAAPRFDSVNSFERPQQVVPRPVAVRAEAGRVRLTLPPASLSVVALRR
ncbi:alpha-N-arabinofuranosidase [Roseateles puraquae]|uniref:non-reducing end alpha-L-arabinofuranosidase n=1 Tax=Roseateles puraquae TaxID=431059 RepID=A0A254NC58_9BURK|nr:alpha-L-arabinofuranosidase C-terminal domain-containing protein [Roseateles puraquae]MDG0854155.1 alpha-N-arabinofuranosidase [Roseateles puraquae]OWR05555.1 alpha-N-arabinofuranosidase [Roseateles puraquae]